MILDARQFERLLKMREGIPNAGFPDIEYFNNGNLIVLRLVDVRTYGGVIRFYRVDGRPRTTGSTTIPLRLRRPFRLAATGVYVWYFHLNLSTLPKEVMAFIVPTPEIAEAGVFFATSRIIGDGGHDLMVPAMMGRMVELEENYPVALLGFMPQQILETEKESEYDPGLSSDATAEATIVPDGAEEKASGTTTSSRSKSKRSK